MFVCMWKEKDGVVYMDIYVVKVHLIDRHKVSIVLL